MKRIPRKRARSPESGFTLIELMVALSLSLFVLGGVIQLYLHNKQYYRFQEAAAQIQGQGRFAIETLSYHLRLAGYREKNPETGVLDDAILAANSRDGGSEKPDEITIQYEASEDCAGNSASPASVQAIAFHFKTGADNGLYCNDEELVGGVENMQVVYGEDTDDDGVANRYLNRNAVADLDNVVSVRVALLIASDVSVGAPGKGKSYSLVGTPVSVLDDGRLRSVYTTTISIRNGDIKLF